jgi:hypothetical protein
MRIHTRCRPAQLAVICGGMIALAACTNAGPPELRTKPLSPAAGAIMTEGEIADSRANTAYDAIQLSHPLFLMSSINVAPLTERAFCYDGKRTREETDWKNRRFPDVYLNGVCLGGIRELRGIPASSVREIRFVRAVDSGAFGVGPGGMILVITKAR